LTWFQLRINTFSFRGGLLTKGGLFIDNVLIGK